MPLAMAKVGATMVVTQLNLETNTLSRLKSLGLTLGAKLTVLSSEFGGPMVITLRGSQLALGHDVVSRILVETVHKEDVR